MTELRYETATKEQLQIARQSLIRLGRPVSEETIREWFAQLNQAATSALAKPDPQPTSVFEKPAYEKYTRPCATREVIARRKPRRKPLRSLEELRALGASGALEKKKPGRKRIVAPWFEQVAHTMRDGTGLKTALLLNDIRLTQREINCLYRLREFKAMYQAERKLWRMEKWGKVAPDEKEALLKRIARHFGAAQQPENG